ncbi:phosphotransferase [Cronobacter turicensis]|uniref:phosphotransferase n=1 Tax=Cronobacter turicensis TaxID=413502 RepID=UPI0035711AF4
MLKEDRMSDDLSRMGDAKVVAFIDETGRQVIEKCPVGDVEYHFYHHAARELAGAGVQTPALLAASPERRKLTLESIPFPLDQNAVADDDVLAMLARLHLYPAHPAWRYHDHDWSASALEASLAPLALPDKSARQFRHFHRHSDVLFYPHGLISGDSNAGNWGRRENGDLVLFDWERFGRGHPAIDLAPLIKGMGTPQAFIQLAERYARLTSKHDVNELARAIAIAKAWIVTEVVTLLHQRQKTALPVYLDWYRENLPGWLEETVIMV